MEPVYHKQLYEVPSISTEVTISDLTGGFSESDIVDDGVKENILTGVRNLIAEEIDRNEKIIKFFHLGLYPASHH